MSIQVADLLEHTACRVHLLRDLVSAVQADSLLLSESGLCGLAMALAEIAGAIDTAQQKVASMVKCKGGPRTAPKPGADDGPGVHVVQ